MKQLTDIILIRYILNSPCPHTTTDTDHSAQSHSAATAPAPLSAAAPDVAAPDVAAAAADVVVDTVDVLPDDEHTSPSPPQICYPHSHLHSR